MALEVLEAVLDEVFDEEIITEKPFLPGLSL